jgi:hypothetical protein
MAKSYKKKMRGGSCSGAADYATKVYGDANSQHASTGGNLIAMNVVKGGKRRSKNVFTNMRSATMKMFGKLNKSMSSRKSRRNRSSRRR